MLTKIVHRVNMHIHMCTQQMYALLWVIRYGLLVEHQWTFCSPKEHLCHSASQISGQEVQRSWPCQQWVLGEGLCVSRGERISELMTDRLIQGLTALTHTNTNRKSLMCINWNEMWLIRCGIVVQHIWDLTYAGTQRPRHIRWNSKT